MTQPSVDKSPESWTCLKVAQLIFEHEYTATTTTQEDPPVLEEPPLQPLKAQDEENLRLMYAYVIALVMDATIALNQTHLMYMTEAERTKRRKATQKRTAFDDPHGQVPNITLRAYLERITKYTKATREALVLSALHMDLYTQRTGRPLAPTMAHRLFMASFVANSKFNDELWHTNNYYSRVAGVTVEEMNQMEIEFLASCGFGLMVSKKDFDVYSNLVYTMARKASQLGGIGSLDQLAHSAVLSAPTRPNATTNSPPSSPSSPMVCEPSSPIAEPTPIAPL